VPYFYLANENGPETGIGTILDVLSAIGSVGVVIVWACECWAYIRNYQCVMRHKEVLHDVPFVRRWRHGSNDLPDDYPYRSHWQPQLAYLFLAACLFILIIANGASLWKNFNRQSFLSAYLAVSRNTPQSVFNELTAPIAYLLPCSLGFAQGFTEGTVAPCRLIEWQ